MDFPRPYCRIRISIRLWDVNTGQQKAKIDGFSKCVKSICYSSDGTTIASGGYDNSIRLWDVRIAKKKQQLLPTTNITIQLISQNHYLEAQGALILKGEFVNVQGIDLKSFFKQKGSLIQN